jgi:NADPH-dependent glutamate synthase beta subunit-like oxidoreductase
MEFLTANTRSLLDSLSTRMAASSAPPTGGRRHRRGDTGTDCIGTAIRHGCRSVVNLELLPEPPPRRAPDNPWPTWPRVLRADYGHAEAAARWGADPREFCTLAKESSTMGRATWEGADRQVTWQAGEGGPARMAEVPGSERVIEADLVLAGDGFLGPEPELANRARGRAGRRSKLPGGERAVLDQRPRDLRGR